MIKYIMMLVDVIETCINLSQPRYTLLHCWIAKMTANTSPINHAQDQGFFLAPLAACPTIPKHPYNKLAELWHHHRQQEIPTKPSEYNSEWTLLTDLDNETFTRDLLTSKEDADEANQQEEEEDFLNWSSYDPTLHLLLIRTPALRPHEQAAATLNTLFLDAVAPTGLKYELDFLGRTTFYNGSGGEKGGAKQADYSFAPRLHGSLPPEGRLREWPSLVIEVSYSNSAEENRAKLESDAVFWLGDAGVGVGAPRGEVRVVLTLRVDQNPSTAMPAITIDKWEARSQGGVERTQQVIIHKKGGSISGAPLVIEFEKLFLRAAAADGGPREGDIEVDAEKLGKLGEMIWRIEEY